VPQTLVRADLDLAADVRLDLATQVTLDLEVVLDPVAQLDELLVTQVLDAGVGLTPVAARAFCALVRPTPKM